jgi:chromatin segregation and condensation protein Rec8/ScpA/Scc1 (kleisin family)
MRRPFYLRPPWNILFELSKLEKLTPWSVNIAYLLRTFLTEMEKANAEKVDFRASGVALDSSALIYLMKSKLLLTLQEPPAAPARVPTDFVPPPLFLPLRHELTSTTIQHLLEVLEDVLKGEKYLSLGHEIEQHPILPAVTDLMPKFDKFIAELENEVDKLFNLLMERTGGQGIIDFTTLVKGKTRIEALRTFIYLLFLAQDGIVSLWQNEETEELYIAVGKLNVAKPTA